MSTVLSGMSHSREQSELVRQHVPVPRHTGKDCLAVPGHPNQKPISLCEPMMCRNGMGLYVNSIL